MIRYYLKFVPLHVLMCEPLYRLTIQGDKWEWNQNHNEIYSKLKSILSSYNAVAHFGDILPIIVATDASSMEQELSFFDQQTKDNKDLYFTPNVNCQLQNNYSTTDREAQAIVFAIDKFHE